MAANHAMRRTPIHHATFHASELGRGSSVEAVNAETIDIAIGMANDVAEMRNPVRERADHRWPRSSRCSDTERILCIRNVENLTIAEKLLIVVATFSTRTVSTTPRQKEDHIHHRSKISWINEGSPSWTRPSHAGRRRGGFLGVGSSKMGMKIKRRRADVNPHSGRALPTLRYLQNYPDALEVQCRSIHFRDIHSCLDHRQFSDSID